MTAQSKALPPRSPEPAAAPAAPPVALPAFLPVHLHQVVLTNPTYYMVRNGFETNMDRNHGCEAVGRCLRGVICLEDQVVALTRALQPGATAALETVIAEHSSSYPVLGRGGEVEDEVRVIDGDGFADLVALLAAPTPEA